MPHDSVFPITSSQMTVTLPGKNAMPESFCSQNCIHICPKPNCRFVWKKTPRPMWKKYEFSSLGHPSLLHGQLLPLSKMGRLWQHSVVAQAGLRPTTWESSDLPESYSLRHFHMHAYHVTMFYLSPQQKSKSNCGASSIGVKIWRGLFDKENLQAGSWNWISNRRRRNSSSRFQAVTSASRARTAVYDVC